MNIPTVDFSKVLGPETIAKLAEANSKGHFSMIMVVSHEALQKLNSKLPAILEGQEGSYIVLVSQSLVEELYE